MGIAGNKGAVAIRMDYGDTSFCFVAAHLASGKAAFKATCYIYLSMFYRTRSFKRR
jgi:hypothetical protein